MQSPGFQHGLPQGLVNLAGAEHHVGHDVIEFFGLVFAKRSTLECLIFFGAYGWQIGDGDLGKELRGEKSLDAAEGSALCAVDAHRQDLGIGHVGHGTGAFINFHKPTRHRDASLRKNHDTPAFFQMVDKAAQRHGIGGINGTQINQGKGRLYPPALGHLAVDGKARFLRQEGRQQGTIQK